MGATPSGHWTTGSLPAPARAAAARAMLSDVHLPWDLDLRDRAPFGMRLAWHGLGGCSLIECHSEPLAGSRGRAEIGRTEGDHMGLLLVLSGREAVRQEDAAVALAPGDLLVWDGTRPIDFAVTERLHKITLLIPRARLARRTGRGGSGRLAGRRIDGRSGLGSVVAAQMTALARAAAEIAPADASLAGDLVVDLLDRLLKPPSPRDGAAGNDLLGRALAHVEAHLDDPALSPTRIARALGITPRYLHMVFAETGGTLGAHIRDRRLARIRRDLADPRLARRSITEIVFHWGFNDAAHASRAFSKAFGVSPSRFRSGCGLYHSTGSR